MSSSAGLVRTSSPAGRAPTSCTASTGVTSSGVRPVGTCAAAPRYGRGCDYF
jgi:hypothetical protein